MTIAKSRAMGWQDTRPLPGLGKDWSFSADWFVSAKITDAIAGGPVVLRRDVDGVLADAAVHASLLAALDELGLRGVFVEESANGHIEAVLASQRGFVRICWSTDGQVRVNLATTDPDLYERVVHLLLQMVTEPDPPPVGSVYALLKDHGDYAVTRVGIVGVPLDRTNYLSGVLDDFDHIVADFQTKAPCGRLVVLSGVPGSGKTFLVRGLISALGPTRATCILVPPHLIEELGDPTLLPALVDAHEGNDGPLVLICEDGDQCLVKRSALNMSSIQSVLNMSDGLMGSMLDLRIVVTTNAEVLEIDKAVEWVDRDGRLCRKIAVGELPGAHANAIVSHLMAGTAPLWSETASVTLATVYKTARSHGWMPADGPVRRTRHRIECAPAKLFPCPQIKVRKKAKRRGTRR